MNEKYEQQLRDKVIVLKVLNETQNLRPEIKRRNELMIQQYEEILNQGQRADNTTD